jgi:hypothetical protein
MTLSSFTIRKIWARVAPSGRVLRTPLDTNSVAADRPQRHELNSCAFAATFALGPIGQRRQPIAFLRGI